MKCVLSFFPSDAISGSTEVATPTPLNVATPPPVDDGMTVIPESPKAATSKDSHSPNKMADDDDDCAHIPFPNKACGKSHTPSPSSNTAAYGNGHASPDQPCSNGPAHKMAYADGKLVALGKRRSSERCDSITTPPPPHTSPNGSKVTRHSADSTVSSRDDQGRGGACGGAAEVSNRGVACGGAEVSSDSSHLCLLGGDQLPKVADSADEFDEMAQSSQLFDFLDEDTPTPTAVATETESHSCSRTGSRFHSGSSVRTSTFDSTSARSMRYDHCSAADDSSVTTPTNHPATSMSEEDSMMKAVEESLKNEVSKLIPTLSFEISLYLAKRLPAASRDGIVRGGATQPCHGTQYSR